MSNICHNFFADNDYERPYDFLDHLVTRKTILNTIHLTKYQRNKTSNRLTLVEFYHILHYP